MPATTIIQMMQALSGMIRHKASIVVFLSPPSNPKAQSWIGGGNYQARVWQGQKEFPVERYLIGSN